MNHLRQLGNFWYTFQLETLAIFYLERWLAKLSEKFFTIKSALCVVSIIFQTKSHIRERGSKMYVLYPIKKRKVHRTHYNRYPDCLLYATCSKQIQSKINKGGCIWNQGGVFGLHKWKLSCIFAIYKTHFLCVLCFYFNRVY